MGPPIQRPKPQTEKHGAAENDDAVIHAHGIRPRRRRPHGEKPDQHRIRHREHGDDGPETWTHPERAPLDLGIGRGEPLVEHHASGEQEGRVVPRDDQGDEGVETDRRTDVDEGQQEVDEDCDADGDEGEGRRFVDLGGRGFSMTCPPFFLGAGWCWGAGKGARLTLAMVRENGRPPSRAKAQSIREAVAKTPTQAKIWATVTMQI